MFRTTERKKLIKIRIKIKKVLNYNIPVDFTAANLRFAQ